MAPARDVGERGMSKPFRRGLVVGKFCPLHFGHELLVRQAQAQCEELVVLSYTKPGFTGHESDRRAAWLRMRFPEVDSHVLDDGILARLCVERGLASREVPADAADDEVHRHFVAWWLADVRGTPVDAVFTSEDYGDGFADVLAARLGTPVRHVCVDKAREAVPVSGTQIRRDPFAWRAYLSPEVYASFVPRVALLGGESTGKSTLAQALANALGTLWAPEYGRELWEAKRGVLVYDDMLRIARTQAEREEALAREASGVLICDTTPLTTALYSEVLFGAVAEELQRLARRRYELVFLCAPDFAFVQDGTRRDEAFRLFQHEWYLGALERDGVAHMVVAGTLEERLALALAAVGEKIGAMRG
jgi:HTH-type transcriptional regulator, transcriptional repressor of NAD biosynthesis genes